MKNSVSTTQLFASQVVAVMDDLVRTKPDLSSSYFGVTFSQNKEQITAFIKTLRFNIPIQFTNEEVEESLEISLDKKEVFIRAIESIEYFKTTPQSVWLDSNSLDYWLHTFKEQI